LRRVVVTGLGVVSPIGLSKDVFFDSLLCARSGVGPIQAAFANQLRIPIVAQVRDFDPAAHFPKERLSQLDRFSQFSLVAARQAWAHAGIGGLAQPEACGTFWGTGLGGAQTLETGYEDLFVKYLNRVRPLSVIACMPNAAAANIAIEFGLQGPCYTYTIACASSAVAVGEAFRAIGSGAVDLALAGGAEAFLTLGILKAWEALMTLAVADKAKPESSCRPFAKDRTGFVPGDSRQLKSAIHIYRAFAELDVTFDNRRLIAEGMDPPPAFAEYLGACIRSGEGEPIADQMRYDFR
jgi:3-oxoacyl-[acyl-carrier-protein] synthase II